MKQEYLLDRFLKNFKNFKSLGMMNNKTAHIMHGEETLK